MNKNIIVLTIFLLLAFIIMSCLIKNKNNIRYYEDTDIKRQSFLEIKEMNPYFNIKSCNIDTNNRYHSGHKLIDSITVLYTEAQYEVRIINDTLLKDILKTNISEEDIINNKDKVFFIEIIINFNGTIDSIKIARNNPHLFILTGEQEDNILKEIKNKQKFWISENAKSYYYIINKPIKITYGFRVRELIEK